MALKILSDNELIRLMSDNTIRIKLKCFKSASRTSAKIAKRAKESCGGCSRKRGKSKQSQAQAREADRATEALADLKRCIKGMPWAQKNELKRILNASKIRLYVPVGDNKIVKITF